MILDPIKREITLMPHIMKMERKGIRLDGTALKKDRDDYFNQMNELDEQIYVYLGREVDIDSSEDLANAIETRHPNAPFKKTDKTKKRSVSKDSLLQAIGAFPELLGPILERNAFATCLRTFIGPWLLQYETHGRLHMQWNQIRNYTETGARTGRLSSSPNLQNIPVEWEQLRSQLEKIHYKLKFELPSVRKYILADEGKILIGRDYSGQELRLLAHFSDGTLLRLLLEEPARDLHIGAANAAGLTRKEAKTLAFAVIYGAGIERISESLEITEYRAREIKSAYLRALPEIKRFTESVQATAHRHALVETLGGRNYRVELASFAYRLVNYKIQGSAADQTKQAMIDFCESADEDEDLLLSVHDQLVIQAPIAGQDMAAAKLEKAMNGSFQEVLKYQIVSDESRGENFAQL